MREWPLLLIVFVATIGTIIRYVVSSEVDFVVIMLALFAAVSFGALVYSLGQESVLSRRTGDSSVTSTTLSGEV